VSAEVEGGKHNGQEREEEGAGSQHTMTAGCCLIFCMTICWGWGVGACKERGKRSGVAIMSRPDQW